jgi:hypothetical protein
VPVSLWPRGRPTSRSGRTQEVPCASQHRSMVYRLQGDGRPSAARGSIPLSFTLDSIGPLAQTVSQCAAAEAVMAGLEASVSVDMPLPHLRIGISRGRLLDNLEPAVAEGFERSLRRLETAGASPSRSTGRDPGHSSSAN